MIVNREYDGITLDDIMMDERESLPVKAVVTDPYEAE